MRAALVFAAVLLGSSTLYPSFAQNQGNSPPQPQTVPVQPERTPQQSDQSREQDQKRADDVRVRPGWRTQDSDDDRTDRMGQNDMERMRDQMGRNRDWDRQTVGRNRPMGHDEDRADRDGYSRNYDGYSRYDHDRDEPRRRVKVCVEYADGDEYCRYRD